MLELVSVFNMHEVNGGKIMLNHQIGTLRVSSSYAQTGTRQLDKSINQTRKGTKSERE